jgi:hypothetical protein
MASLISLEGLASVSGRHPWRIILLWVIGLVIFGGLAATQLGDTLTSDIRISADAESIEGFGRLQESGIEDAAPLTETVVIWSTDGRTIDDPSFIEGI